MVAGDSSFYHDLYTDFGKDGPWTEGTAERGDHTRAAALIKSQD